MTERILLHAGPADSRMYRAQLEALLLRAHPPASTRLADVRASNVARSSTGSS